MQLILQRTAVRLDGVLLYLKTTEAPSVLAENVHSTLSAYAFSSSFSLHFYKTWGQLHNISHYIKTVS